VLIGVGGDRPMVADFEDALRLMTLPMRESEGYIKIGPYPFRAHNLLKRVEKGKVVHHGDGDALNNQKYNLKEETKNKHGQIHMAGKKNIGIYKARNKKFKAHITNKGIHLGTYDTAEEAGLAYDWAARALYGPGCAVNFADRLLPETAEYLIRTSRGEIEVEFIKRTDGGIRRLKCHMPRRYAPYQSSGSCKSEIEKLLERGKPDPFSHARHNLIIVESYEIGFRAIPVEGLVRVKIGGREYKVISKIKK
jgi:hypothetical protein